MISLELKERLAAIVGADYVLTSDMELTLYSYDAYLVQAKPDVVVLPGDADQVSRVVRLAYENGLPVVARGAATSLTGGPVPVKGGLVLHFGRMNRILEIDVENRTATVEPGVITLHLQNEVAKTGLQYAPDPASQKTSTLGGNVGENAGGPHCLKYGVTTNHVLGLEVVLYDGSAIQVGGTAPEMPGLDLPGLLVGSEGTLGIATKIILKLILQPEAIKTLLAVFETIRDAGNTVSAVIADGIIPATLEMMDNLVIQAVEDSMRAGYPRDAGAVLIIELDGLQDGFDRLSRRIMDICRDNKVREVRAAKDEAERTALWAGRKGAFGAISRLRPNYLVCDGTVPRTKLPEVLDKVLKLGQEHNLRIGNVFHAGDGNLHPLILFDLRDKGELERVEKVGREILRLCAEAGGTISGEHGIGMEKLKEMAFVFSPDDIEFMRKIKRAWDPLEILNPGKVLPPEE
ncbi:MAG: FAD-linked oxidase C-terminal domain-containing protein [Thermodesulfobacteriota bacterium]